MRFSFLLKIWFLGVAIQICSLTVHAQYGSGRKPVPLGAQPDLRFIVKAERLMNSEGDEEYFFYVINNTDDEYKLKIRITLDLACYGQQVFYLGYTDVIQLKPRAIFSEKLDGRAHIFMGAKAESRKNCVLKDEQGKLTFLKSAIFYMSDIENITQKKQAEKKRLEEEQATKARIESERKKIEEQKRIEEETERQRKQKAAEENKQILEPVNQQKRGQSNEDKSTVESNDNFWSEKKSTKPNNASTNPNYHKLPDVFYTTNGQYWKKYNGEIVEITKEEYTNLKNASKNSNSTSSSNELKESAEEKQRIIDKFIADGRAQQEAYQKNFDEINRKFDVISQSNQMRQNIDESKRALAENTTMSGNYQNSQQVMAEFSQKMRSINQTTSQLQQQRQQQLNYVTSNYYASNDRAGQIASGGMKVLGTIVNASKANKEKKEAQAALKAEREEALRRVAEAEKKMLTELRTDLFKRYKEAQFPAANSNLQNTTLYFFVYAYDPAQIATKQAVLYVSNVFQIDKYSDGTWPYKNSIISEIDKLTPYPEVLHGYYSDANNAEDMRQVLMKIFTEANGNVKNFSYRANRLSSISGNNKPNEKLDFWETTKKSGIDSSDKKKIDTAKTSKDKFWKN